MAEVNQYDYDFEYDEVGNLVRVYNTLGDLNCNFSVSPGDTDPFVMALINPTEYEATYPDCDRMRAYQW